MTDAIYELEILADWVRSGNYNRDDARDEIARAIENRVRELKARRTVGPMTPQQRCDEWNRLNPIGTVVEYRHRTRITRSTAQVLANRSPVVWLEGESCCVHLDNCVVVTP